MKTDWFPNKRDEILAMAANWAEYITTEKAVAWGIPAATMTELSTLRATAAAKLAVVESAEKTAVAVEECKAAFAELETAMRDAKKRHFLTPPLVDADYTGLSLPIPDRTRSPVPPPATRPVFTLKPGDTRQVVINFKDEASESKAYGYNGTVVSYALLSAPPSDQTALIRSDMATKTPLVLTFTEEERGQQVYIALCWQNAKGEKGSWTDERHCAVRRKPGRSTPCGNRPGAVYWNSRLKTFEGETLC
jgi:hypothetical protein